MAHARKQQRDDKMLTPTEAHWVAEYIATSSIAKASAAAGYASSTNLLDRPHVAKVTHRKLEKIMGKKAVTAERVVAELAKIAFANVDDFVDDDYRIREKPKRGQMAAVASVTTKTRHERTRGDDDVFTTIDEVKLTMASKLGALDMLGKHFGIYAPEKVDIGGPLSEQLDRAFARMAEQDKDTNE